MYLLSERRSFLFVVFSNVFLFALDVFWIFINENALQVPSIWNWIVDALYYTVSGLAGFLWFYYSETIQKSKLATNKRYLLIAFLPEILLVILSATAYISRPEKGVFSLVTKKNIFTKRLSIFPPS